MLSVPVSRPVLTLRTPAQAVVGDVVQLTVRPREALPRSCTSFIMRMSPSEQLKSSGEGASFNLFLKTEHFPTTSVRPIMARGSSAVTQCHSVSKVRDRTTAQPGDRPSPLLCSQCSRDWRYHRDTCQAGHHC